MEAIAFDIRRISSILGFKPTVSDGPCGASAGVGNENSGDGTLEIAISQRVLKGGLDPLVVAVVFGRYLMPYDILNGIKVVEVATFAFVPSAGAILQEWGAEVVKIEDPQRPDPMRESIIAKSSNAIRDGSNFIYHSVNREKAGVAIDLKTDLGKELLIRLVSEADVFITNVRGPSRIRMGIEPSDIFAINPKVVYARGTGYGPKGPDADKPGFDTAGFWSQAGVAYVLASQLGNVPMHPPAFGDSIAGMFLAGGIAAALFRRERTGRGGIVDVSLLSAGVWAMGASVAGAAAVNADALPTYSHKNAFNPLVAAYKCKDGRFIQLVMTYADRHWPELCRFVGREDLLDDPLFVTADLRSTNSALLVRIFDEVFATRSLKEWRQQFASFEAPWVVVQAPGELPTDPQVVANKYIQHVGSDAEGSAVLAAGPVQFDEYQVVIDSLGPAHGENTEECLLQLGYTWDEIAQFKDSRAII